MTPEEHAAQSLRMETKMDALLVQNTRIETYQKTHYKAIQDLGEDQKKISLRVDKTEKNINRAGGGFSIALLIMGAWVSDLFKSGGG